MDSKRDGELSPSGLASCRKFWWWPLVVTLVAFAAVGMGFFVGGQAALWAQAGLRVLPFLPLAVLGQASLCLPWLKYVALTWLAIITLGAAAIAVGVGLLSTVVQPGGWPNSGASLSVQLVKLVALAAGALIAGIAVLAQPVQVALARFVPLRPGFFTDALATSSALGFGLLALVPLLAGGMPPIVSLARVPGDIMPSQEAYGAIWQVEVYSLGWTVLAAFLAVGWGVRRNLREAAERLGLRRLSAKDMIYACLLAFALLGLMAAVALACDWMRRVFGCGGASSYEARGIMEELLAPFRSVQGMLALGLSAAVGEELAIRGVLQPRVGIVLSNFFFAALHAYQYTWDGVLTVFVLGCLLALIRRRRNTSLSIAVHALYDILLLAAMAAGIISAA